MIATRRRIAPSAAVAAAVALVGATACAIPENWGAKSPQQHLVETLLDTWASPGQKFLEGVVNADTIEGMTQAGDRSRNVTLPGMSAAGDHQEWNIEITKADVLPVHAGDAFVQWLGERSQALGSRDFLPRDVVSALNSGSITAVGDVEASFGRTDRTGRSKVDRVAYLMAGKKGKDPAWVLQPRSRTPVMLRDMLVKVYEDMIRNDDSALTCLGEVERGSDKRTGQLKCIKQVIDLKFR